MAQTFAVSTKRIFNPLKKLHNIGTLVNEERYKLVAFGQCTEIEGNFDELPTSDTGDYLHPVF